MGIFFWLEGMVAAEGLVNEGEGSLRGFEEERVVVTTDEAVEGCELGGRKCLDVPWRNVLVLQYGSSSVLTHTAS